MKQIVIVSFLCFSSFIEAAKYPIKSFEIDQDEFNIVYNQLLPLQDKLAVGDTNEVIAILNNYTDKLLPNIHTFAVDNELDPIKLDDYSNWFLTASITLTNGSIGDFSEIERNGDVKLSYSSESKVLDLVVPIKLNDIYFKYNYHVIILLIGPKGVMTGKIRDLTMEIELEFDFDDYQATCKEADVKSSGHIDVTFDGGLIEIVVNILSELTTTILHPLLVLIIQGTVKSACNAIVDSINDIINNILNP
ncbi:hypothetical protein GWI33_005925 [Rhynchophorus ferrugineus]|uniref:Uncharacterized protein n=1 Tax=Rhynchophorus ferrugineus TaxID=354439 RepID=A0A834MLH1_RHYFE|nr:hypothetical protein GWI33_005925 [Rhynchophorus ferrugineus]